MKETEFKLDEKLPVKDFVLISDRKCNTEDVDHLVSDLTS